MAQYSKVYPGRTPSSEVSLNYTAVWATVQAMKLAGTVTDAVAIRAQLDKEVHSLGLHADNESIGVLLNAHALLRVARCFACCCRA